PASGVPAADRGDRRDDLLLRRPPPVAARDPANRARDFAAAHAGRAARAIRAALDRAAVRRGPGGRAVVLGPARLAPRRRASLVPRRRGRDDRVHLAPRTP